VQWYSKLFRFPRVRIERYDHFVKQTYRNRCVIATADGPLALTVPIESDGGGKQLMRDVRVSNHGKWRKEHWNALCAAYGETPFFEYLADDIAPFFEQSFPFLFDFNLRITECVCDLLDIHPVMETTDEYCKAPEGGVIDLRESIRPKHPAPDNAFTPRPYYQVFRGKTGFLPNLSILDLLFNEGPEAVRYL